LPEPGSGEFEAVGSGEVVPVGVLDGSVVGVPAVLADEWGRGFSDLPLPVPVLAWVDGDDLGLVSWELEVGSTRPLRARATMMPATATAAMKART